MFFSSFPLFSLLLLAGRYCHSECVEKQEQSVGADHRGPAFVSLFDESGFQLTCPSQEFAAASIRHLQITWGAILSTFFGKPCRTTGLSHRPRDGPQRTRHASDKTHPQTRGQCAWQGKAARGWKGRRQGDEDGRRDNSQIREPLNPGGLATASPDLMSFPGRYPNRELPVAGWVPALPGNNNKTR